MPMTARRSRNWQQPCAVVWLNINYTSIATTSYRFSIWFCFIFWVFVSVSVNVTFLGNFVKLNVRTTFLFLQISSQYKLKIQAAVQSMNYHRRFLFYLCLFHEHSYTMIDYVLIEYIENRSRKYPYTTQTMGQLLHITWHKDMSSKDL